MLVASEKLMVRTLRLNIMGDFVPFSLCLWRFGLVKCTLRIAAGLGATHVEAGSCRRVTWARVKVLRTSHRRGAYRGFCVRLPVAVTLSPGHNEREGT